MVGYKGNQLVADTLEELHLFAKKCGMKEDWFHSDNPEKIHYSVYGKRGFAIIVKNGAVALNEKQLQGMFKSLQDSAPNKDARDIFECIDNYSVVIRKEIAKSFDAHEWPDLIPDEHKPPFWKEMQPKEKVAFFWPIAKYIWARV